ncbi:CueP family metal-binding protein [Microbacterium resistens]|nr:CueP family metal-binding protein [Streptomyces sp. MS2A]
MTTPIPRRRRWTAAVAVVAALTLGGCAAAPSAGGQGPESGAALLADHGLAGLDAVGVVDALDALPVAERSTELMASVRPDAVLLSDARGRETRLEMPGDQVYLSVAPYRSRTHECFFHSLTTCLGELGDTEVHVTVTSVDGAVLIDETRRTFDNGFVGLWVPRGVEGTLSVSADGRTGTVPFSTLSDEDPTCITTLQLA